MVLLQPNNVEKTALAIDCCNSHKLNTTDLKSADFSEITCHYVDAYCVIENSMDLINESADTWM